VGFRLGWMDCGSTKGKLDRTKNFHLLCLRRHGENFKSAVHNGTHRVIGRIFGNSRAIGPTSMACQDHAKRCCQLFLRFWKFNLFVSDDWQHKYKQNKMLPSASENGVATSGLHVRLLIQKGKSIKQLCRCMRRRIF
jgi:hypothetical protein